MQVTPRYLLLDSEETPSTTTHPVEYHYTYKPSELSKKKTIRESVVTMHVSVHEESGEPTPALLHVYGFRPQVAYTVQCPGWKVANNLEKMQKSVNAFLHGKFANKPEERIFDGVYVCKISVTPKHGDLSLIEMNISRPDDVRPWLINAALTQFLTSDLNIYNPAVKLATGENARGNVMYTYKTAAQSFKDAMQIDFSCKLIVHQYSELGHTDGVRKIYTSYLSLEKVERSQEDILSFFENKNTRTFDMKIYNKTFKTYTAEEMRSRDKVQAQKMTGDVQVHYDKHANEYRLRLFRAFTAGNFPAHEKMHLLRDSDFNDQDFFFGIPPWHSDGTPNPLGIPDQREIEWNKNALP